MSYINNFLQIKKSAIISSSNGVQTAGKNGSEYYLKLVGVEDAVVNVTFGDASTLTLTISAFRGVYLTDTTSFTYTVVSGKVNKG